MTTVPAAVASRPGSKPWMRRRPRNARSNCPVPSVRVTSNSTASWRHFVACVITWPPTTQRVRGRAAMMREVGVGATNGSSTSSRSGRGAAGSPRRVGNSGVDEVAIAVVVQGCRCEEGLLRAFLTRRPRLSTRPALDGPARDGADEGVGPGRASHPKISEVPGSALWRRQRLGEDFESCPRLRTGPPFVAEVGNRRCRHKDRHRRKATSNRPSDRSVVGRFPTGRLTSRPAGDDAVSMRGSGAEHAPSWTAPPDPPAVRPCLLRSLSVLCRVSGRR